MGPSADSPDLCLCLRQLHNRNLRLLVRFFFLYNVSVFSQAFLRQFKGEAIGFIKVECVCPGNLTLVFEMLSDLDFSLLQSFVK